jgi:hypothetical protein
MRAPARPASAAPSSESAAGRTAGAPRKRATDSQQLATASASPLRFPAPQALRESLTAQASSL